MRKYGLRYLLIIMILPYMSYAQCTNVKDPIDNAIPYLYVDKAPSYTRGNKEFVKYLHNNIQMPNNFCGTGRVVVSFVVTKDGNIRNVKVSKSLDMYTDREAIRVLEKMPKWKPGKLNGKYVDVLMYVPVYFIPI